MNTRTIPRPDIHGRDPVEEYVQFDSIPDMVRWLDREGGELAKRKGYLPSNDTITVKPVPFNRESNLKKTLELARYGWKEGRDRLSPYQAALDREFKREVQADEFRSDVSGFEVDVPTYLTGQPEHMLSYLRGQPNARHVRVIVDINVRCSACGRRQHDADPTKPEVVLSRGAAITMLMQALVRGGFRPRLTARTTSFYNSHHEWPTFKNETLRTVDVTLYEPGYTFDLDAINFALSHESFIRRMEWRVHEILNHQQSQSDLYRHRINRQSEQPVGVVPLGSACSPRFMSAEPYGDVFIPAEFTLRELHKTLINEAGYNQQNVQPAIEQLLKVVHPALKPSVLKAGSNVSQAMEDPNKNVMSELRKIDDSSPLRAAQWVFNTLRDQGVRFR